MATSEGMPTESDHCFKSAVLDIEDCDKYSQVVELIDAGVYEATREGHFDKFINALNKFSADTQLSRSAIFDQVGPLGNSLLHVAARSGHKEIIEFIVHNHPSIIYRRNIKGETALHVAARGGMKNIVETLVSTTDNNSLLMEKNECGNTVLHEAVMNRHHDVVKFLTFAYPQLCYFKNEDGWSPIYMAVKIHDIEILKSLLEGLSGPFNRLEGEMPGHAAVMEGRTDMLVLMATRDPEVLQSTDQKGRTTLHWAAFEGNVGAVDFLLRGQYIASTCLAMDEEGLLPIHIASKRGHVEVVKKLLTVWSDPVDLLTREGQNILHVAAAWGKDNIVRYILNNPMMVKLLNEKDKNGDSPLHLAALYAHSEVVFTLTWDKRVKLNLLNKKGLMPLDVFLHWNAKSFHEGPNMQRNLTATALLSAGCKQNNRPEIKDQNSKPQKVEWVKDGISTLLTVSTLVTTCTFAAGFTVPGGYKGSEGLDKGTAIMLNDLRFQVFIVCNTSAFCCSILCILSCFHAFFTDAIIAIRALLLAQGFFGAAIGLMSLALVGAIQVAAPVSKLSWLTVVTLILMGILCLACLFAFLNWILNFLFLTSTWPFMRFPFHLMGRAMICICLKRVPKLVQLI